MTIINDWFVIENYLNCRQILNMKKYKDYQWHLKWNKCHKCKIMLFATHVLVFQYLNNSL